ncbi:hypothetical protein [Nitratireductor sp. GCM10026969]|uniref:hypothetical protein n=1 Tax=Nitratireductor sp. GCM10026969 TaxID=3252645 RepID=UPI00361BED12
MNDKREHGINKATSGHVKEKAPSEKGGSQARKAQEWGGGTKAAKGPVTKEDRRNPNSSQKS